jgi:FkbM family methyltransferase
VKRISARHPHWDGFLLLLGDGVVFHEGHGTRGTYEMHASDLTITWEQFGSESFRKIGGAWIHHHLLATAVGLERLSVVRAFGKPYLATRIQLEVPEVRCEVELRLNSSDVPTFWQVFVNSEYESPELPSSASSIVDLGANIGLATLYFAARYPQSSILAVEPEPDNFKLLLRNTQSLGSRVHRHRAAVWRNDGLISLRTKDDNNRPLGEWGVQVTASPQRDEPSTPCFRLPTLLQLAGFQSVDILKVDIEGAELEVFSEDLTSCLERIRMIIIETHDRFRPGSEAAVRKAIAPLFEERPSKGENLFFIRKS